MGAGLRACRGSLDGRIVYADHAATSWPKPPPVARAMVDYLEQAGANPGRSAHRLAVAAARAVFATRQAVARFLGCSHEARIVFGPNATWGINLALYGLLEPGDHVVTSTVEHNAVARPLYDLRARGVDVTRVRCSPEGHLDLDDLRRALGRRTRLVVLTHASNVTGTILPVAAAARLAHEEGALVLVDAAQTAGCLPLDVTGMDLDLVAFTGHKALLGPQGTGGLYIREGISPRPLVRGGTGSLSHLEEQPDLLPDVYESGTLNGVGLAGLGAAVRYLADVGTDAVRQHELGLASRLLDGLRDIPGVRVHGPPDAQARVALVSFTVAGADPARVGELLDSDFGVMVRTGLHCAPWAHRTAGTYPAGTVRISLGYSNTLEEVDYVVSAVARVAARLRRERPGGRGWTACSG
ncbi:MAG: aminotransferase class V-fold PLP-dependent enzyme [Bacillota bacterium]